MLTKSEFFTRFTTALPASDIPSSSIYFLPINMDCLEEMHSYSLKDRFYEYLEFSPFKDIKETLADAIIGAQGNVIEATKAVNSFFKMKNDFPIFMAVIDLAWFRPDVIDPASHVPTGIGAVAYLDRLQIHFGLDDHRQTCDRMISLQKDNWPEAKRAFQPIDIEYLSCECRKYYSYVNGTKLFKGKNRFQPKR